MKTVTLFFILVVYGVTASSPVVRRYAQTAFVHSKQPRGLFREPFDKVLRTTERGTLGAQQSSVETSLVSQLNDMSVWRVSDTEWDTASYDDDEAKRPWVPYGLLLVKRLDGYPELPARYEASLDPVCVSSEQQAPDTLIVNGTVCPGLKVSVQLANTITMRLVVTPDGSALSYDIRLTDSLGTRDVLELEARLLDALSVVSSVYVLGGAPKRKLIFHGHAADFTFLEIGTCSSAACVGLLATERAGSFWILERIQRGDKTLLEPENVDIGGIGVWLTNENHNNSNADVSLLPLSVGPLLSQTVVVPPSALVDSHGTRLRTNVATGDVSHTSKGALLDLAGIRRNAMLDDVNLLVQRASRLTWGVLEVPWALTIEAPLDSSDLNSITSAIFRLAYYGPP